MSLMMTFFGWLRVLIRKSFILFAVCLPILESCKPTSNKTPVDSSYSDNSDFESLPEDFKSFYLKFHSDSSFQMNHLSFPLAGLPDYADPEFIGNEPYYWSADQWVIQKADFLNSKEYVLSYFSLGGVLIEERIYDKKFDLTIIRRFANSGGSWNLIYYAGLNRYKSNENPKN